MEKLIQKKTPQGENLKTAATAIFQTVGALEGKFASNYCIQLLRGRQVFGLRKEAHQNLPTFGALADFYSEKLAGLIRYFLEQGYLRVTNAQFGSLGLTAKGEQFLAEPEDLILRPRVWQEDTFDQFLRERLRELRSIWAREEAKPPYTIFTDYTLARIVIEKPVDLPELKMVPGLGDYKVNRYGPALLNAVAEIQEQKRQDRIARTRKRALTPSHQAVKSMFEAGESLEDMAEKRQVKIGTIRSNLYTLHQAGEVDLSPWIEDQLAPEDFEKGKAFFEASPDARLKDAFEALGLDYETLRYCKLYVSHASSQEVQLKMAS
ncbi:MAG: RQC domain-containing protein [Bacteroidota bacterium]